MKFGQPRVAASHLKPPSTRHAHPCVQNTTVVAQFCQRLLSTKFPPVFAYRSMSSRRWSLLCELGYPLRLLGPDRGARGRHPHRGVLVLPSRVWHQLSTPSKQKICAHPLRYSYRGEDLHPVGGLLSASLWVFHPW